LAALKRSPLAGIDADALHGEISAVLDAFAVELETAMPRQILARTLDLADRFDLTAYDGVYLEAAWRLGATLCSLDEPLLAAARELGLRTLQDPA
jgi:predicted nucleic acid-binding protein